MNQFVRQVICAVTIAIAARFMCPATLAQEVSREDTVDHAAIISRWDQQSVERGEKLFQIACAPCHGTDGVHTINPQSRPFAVDKFQNGNDPYSLYKTISYGFKNMPSQAWMTPEQRYDVIHYIRETFLKRLNRSQYYEISSVYLDSLPKASPRQPKTVDVSATEQDFGPARESQLGTNFNDVLTIRLQDNVTVSYDLHHLRLAGAWRDGFLDLSRTGNAQQRGEGQPLPGGKALKGMQHWLWAFHGQFDYSTNNLLPRGPLPPDWMQYHGHYVHGQQVVLSFAIDGREVLELPTAAITNNLVLLTHALRIGPGHSALRLCIGQLDEATAKSAGIVPFGQTIPVGKTGPAEGHLVIAAAGPKDSNDDNFIAAAVSGQVAGLTLQVEDDRRLVLTIPAADQARVIQVVCTSGHGDSELKWLGQYLKQMSSSTALDPGQLTHGGPRLSPVPVVVKGKLGEQKGAYVLDTIPVPFENPHHSWLRTSALAFFPDGRAVITTYGGEVWIVSSIDAKLEHVTWSRFASGLFEPLGVQVIKGLIYVTCRNGIVRLLDVNGDGEADFYETFFADTDVSTFFHSFSFDLQVDRKGKLYYLKAGEYTDYNLPGALIEVSPDGQRSQAYCTGFRVPNGMGILPNDQLTASDNQGDWMPASKINLVHKGGFYGYVQTQTGGGLYGDRWAPDGGQIDPQTVKVPASFDQPIIWMPQEFDNSSGGQVWVSDKRFGPLSGRLLHTSFGKGWMYYLMLQKVEDVNQAAIVALPFQFDAGIMRARVNPKDGQVYATGLSGWQGPADGKDGCLQRLRYTGEPIRLLDDVKVVAGGLTLRFNFLLEPASATNPANYHLEEWNYLWSSQYGSDQYSVEHPGQKGHDQLVIRSIQLAKDRRSVVLAIPGIRPVHQVEIKLNLAAADGNAFKELAYLTINAVPAR
jgi:glucose/arabinose dehydrogenase